MLRSQRFRHFLNTLWPYALIIIGLIAVEAPQLANQQTILSHQILIDFNRIYNADMQLQHHNISYWINLYGFKHAGVWGSSLASPYLTYCLGWLLSQVKSLYNLQITLAFVLPFLSAVSFQAGLKIARFSSTKVKWLIVIYPFTYQIMNWLISGSAVSLGMLIAPLVVGCLTQMFRGGDNTQIIPIQLSAVIALSFQLSLAIGFTVLILYLLAIPYTAYVSGDRRTLVKDYTKTAVITFLMVLNLVAGAWELASNKHVLSYPASNHGLDFSNSAPSEFVSLIILALFVFCLLVTRSLESQRARSVGYLAIIFYLLSIASPLWKIGFQVFKPLRVLESPASFSVLAVTLALFFLAELIEEQTLASWFQATVIILLFITGASSVASSSYAVSQHSNLNANSLFRSRQTSRALVSQEPITTHDLPVTSSLASRSAVTQQIQHIIYDRSDIKVHVDKSELIYKVHSSRDTNSSALPLVAYQNTQVSPINDASVTSSSHEFKSQATRIPHLPLHKGWTTVEVDYHENIVSDLLIIANLAVWAIWILVLAISWLQWKYYYFEQNHRL